jgi:hypothetical protein
VTAKQANQEQQSCYRKNFAMDFVMFTRPTYKHSIIWKASLRTLFVDIIAEMNARFKGINVSSSPHVNAENTHEAYEFFTDKFIDLSVKRIIARYDASGKIPNAEAISPIFETAINLFISELKVQYISKLKFDFKLPSEANASDNQKVWIQNMMNQITEKTNQYEEKFIYKAKHKAIDKISSYELERKRDRWNENVKWLREVLKNDRILLACASFISFCVGTAFTAIIHVIQGLIASHH